MKDFNVRAMTIESELLEQVLNKMSKEKEKNRKIYKMSSLQRKKHQRQFAVLHFLLKGMEKFVGELSMNSIRKKSIIVVCDAKTSQAANFLVRQINEMEKLGISLNAVLCSSYEFEKSLKKGENLSKKYIIYVGNFLESKKACDSIQHWRFNDFGFRYGWLGYIAVITFERKPSKDEFGQMVDISETEFTEMKHQIDMLTKLEGNLWNELSTTQQILLCVGVFAAMAFLGIHIAARVADADENKRKEDMDEIIKNRHGSPDSKYLPKDIIHTNLNREGIEEIKYKTKMEDFTDEEWEYINDSEYGEEWIERDDELRDMTLEDYHDMRCVEDYGLDNEDMDCGDEESVICDYDADAKTSREF